MFINFIFKINDIDFIYGSRSLTSQTSTNALAQGDFCFTSAGIDNHANRRYIYSYI